MPVDIEDAEYEWLSDTGAVMSTWCSHVTTDQFMSASSETSVGASGKPFVSPVNKSWDVITGSRSLEHAFVLTPQTSVNMFGRDLLYKMEACVNLCAGRYLLVPTRNLHF